MENENKNELDDQAENENSSNDGTQTSEDTSKGGSGDGDNKEESPYAAQLKEYEDREAKLKEELEGKDEIIEKKENTIQALKKAKKEAPVIDESELEKRILARFREENQAGDLQSKVAKITSDPTEQKLILKIRETRVVKTGDIEQELLDAVAIANRDVVITQKRNQAIEEKREDFMTSFKTPAIRGATVNTTIDPVQREAEALVARINPNAVKNVKKQFQN